MVVSQGPGTLELFDPETYTRTGVIQVGQMPNWIATSADGHTAYVTNEGSNDVTVVDLTTETVTATFPVGGGPRRIALQPATGSMPIDGSGTSATNTDALASPPSVAAASIMIAGFAFSPATVTVSPGQAIIFTNADAVTHTTTSLAGAWDSGFIAPGGSYTLTLQQPGTYTYHCSIHPFMQGTVVVTS